MKRDIEKLLTAIDEQYERMLTFKEKNGLEINPMKTLRGWAEYIVVEREGYCPCRNDRPACPCEEALSEIKGKGKCFCGKFFTPKRFKEVWGSKK